MMLIVLSVVIGLEVSAPKVMVASFFIWLQRRCSFNTVRMFRFFERLDDNTCWTIYDPFSIFLFINTIYHDSRDGNYDSEHGMTIWLEREHQHSILGWKSKYSVSIRISEEVEGSWFNVNKYYVCISE